MYNICMNAVNVMRLRITCICYVKRLIVNTILISVLMCIETGLKYHHFKNKIFNSGNVNDCQTLLSALVFLKLHIKLCMPIIF